MSVWDDIVGQENAVAAFNAAALAARETAEQREASTPGTASAPPDNAGSGGADCPAGFAMSHAWLVTGPPGSGRSNAARAFAAALQLSLIHI